MPLAKFDCYISTGRPKTEPTFRRIHAFHVSNMLGIFSASSLKKGEHLNDDDVSKSSMPPLVEKRGATHRARDGHHTPMRYEYFPPVPWKKGEPSHDSKIIQWDPGKAHRTPCHNKAVQPQPFSTMPHVLEENTITDFKFVSNSCLEMGSVTKRLIYIPPWVPAHPSNFPKFPLLPSPDFSVLRSTHRWVDWYFHWKRSKSLIVTIPHSELKKRHIGLSYHRTRKAIAAGIVAFYHISSVSNPADLLRKHWGFQTAWPLLKSLPFWVGDTAKIPDGVTTKAKMALGRTKGECNKTGSQPSLVSHGCMSKRD
jgi:hypothetical protein